MLLNNDQVLCLCEELQNLLIKAYQIQGRENEIPKGKLNSFGNKPPKGKDAARELTIYTLLRDHPRVKAFMESQPGENLARNHLYLQNLDARKPGADTKTFPFEGIYKKIYFLPFGEEYDKDSFFKKYLPSQKVHFLASYFSFGTHKTESFHVELEGYANKEVRVRIWGFGEKYGEEELSGTMNRIGNCWRISAKPLQAGLYLDIILHTGVPGITDSEKLLQTAFLRGILCGISSAHHPVALECFLERTAHSEPGDPTMDIQRYLNLSRNNFHVAITGQADLMNVNRLDVDGYSLHLLTHLANRTWRILTYNDANTKPLNNIPTAEMPERKPSILQSVFFIGEDLTATITVPILNAKPTDPDDNPPHKCYLSITRYDGPKLMVKVLEKDDHNLFIFTILEFPSLNEVNRVLRGAFCNTGYHTEKPIGGFFVMKEDEPGLTVQVDTKEKLDQEKPDAKRRDLLAELYRINKLDIPDAWK